MSFRFDFSANGDDTIQEDVKDNSESDSGPDAAAEEIPFSARDTKEHDFDTIWLCPNLFLFKGNVASHKASITLNSGDVAVSDLVPGKYEGGFKLWECAVDLAIHLCTTWQVTCSAESATTTTSLEDVRSKRVMDLGCGHGLPGLLAARLGMETHFQDYNKEVLTFLTMPNVERNNRELKSSPNVSEPCPQTRFFSGSWESLTSLLRQENLAGSYDYIFSSDTIYSPASQRQLLDCIYEALKVHGKAFIAAKSYYFGVGGGVVQFKALALQQNKFSILDGPVFDDGASNRREIFTLVKFK